MSWIARTSLKKHSETAGHARHVLQRSEHEEAERQRRALIQSRLHAPTLPDSATATHNSASDLHRGRYPAMFDQDQDTSSGFESVYDGGESESHYGPGDQPRSGLNHPLNTIPINFAPIPRHNPATKHQELMIHFSQLLEQSLHDNEFGPEDLEPLEDEVTNLAEDFQGRMGVHEEPSNEEVFGLINGDIPINMSARNDYFPYPNKVMMLLDIMDNMPRLRISSNTLRMFLWVLKECNVPNTPSYDAFRKMQHNMHGLIGSEPKMHKSKPLDNVFYVNDIRESVAMDFANPEVAKHLHFYPEESKGPISEAWQAGRLRQFYIEEVAQISCGSYVIPHDMVIRNGVLSSKCSLVVITPSGWCITPETITVNSDSFSSNYEDILAKYNGFIPWAEDVTVPIMPNPLRKIAQGNDLYVVMLPLWCDDVSGNQSKQYNKHMNMYMSNSNIPGRLLQQEYFVRFVSTSPSATAPEQFSVLRDQINDTRTNPIRCFNAHTSRKCAVILQVPDLPADNPQQSEEASHMGTNTNHGCRKCDVGGSHEITESDKGYHALYSIGELRSAEKTRACLEKQLLAACTGVQSKVTEIQTATGVKDKITEYWIEKLIARAREEKSKNPGKSVQTITDELQQWLNDQPGDKYNPLLSIEGLDPTQHTPVEILHTILLGIMKYVWFFINKDWSDEDRAIFAIRLQSTDLDGLTVPPLQAAYMIQYRNNLIGKHFKTLMQTMAFQVHNIVNPRQLEVIKSVSALGSMLWMHEIDDMDQYLDDLKIHIANFLDAFAELEPSKIIMKAKLHLLVHLPEDIRRFGPPIRYSTEVYESFNRVFRLCSIYSNHQSPSRDIAFKFASMDRLKHILSGGLWRSGNDWVQAGNKVLLLHTHPIVQRHLGWVPEVRKQADHSQWIECLSMVAQSGDVCKKQSWVYFEIDGKSSIGRICEILLSQDGSEETRITLEKFSLLEELHLQLKLPLLRRPSLPEEKYVSVKATDILFIISVQHDCHLLQCQPSLTRLQVQERQITSREEKLIKHRDENNFILNTYAIHNSLSKPQLIYADREAYHVSIAAKLRVSQTSKRAETQKKRKATMARKEAKRQEQMEQGIREDESEDEMEGLELEGETSERPNKRRRDTET
ncbi:hypothetical protein CPC08DRAFT_803425 [Agrocybe pediades]|nr:hypothetical protein CPC08DRAFT_803425 [Agrocybe pediades]